MGVEFWRRLGEWLLMSAVFASGSCFTKGCCARCGVQWEWKSWFVECCCRFGVKLWCAFLFECGFGVGRYRLRHVLCALGVWELAYEVLVWDRSAVVVVRGVLSVGSGSRRVVSRGVVCVGSVGVALSSVCVDLVSWVFLGFFLLHEGVVYLRSVDIGVGSLLRLPELSSCLVNLVNPFPSLLSCSAGQLTAEKVYSAGVCRRLCSSSLTGHWQALGVALQHMAKPRQVR